MTTPVLLEERPLPGCVQLTLNRPQAKNALSQALRRDLVTTLDQLAADAQTRVLILTGAGDAFCAGLDLKELGQTQGADGLALQDPALNPIAALQRFPGAVIGAVNGVAITGGFELALACDVVLCSHGARFADTHARIGVMPFWGLSQKLSRVLGLYRAKELSLTGNFLSAETAERWGLVNRVLGADRLLPAAHQLAAEMLSVVPEMLVAYKRLIDDGFALPYQEGVALEARTALISQEKHDPAELERRRHAVRARGQQQIDSVAPTSEG